MRWATANSHRLIIVHFNGVSNIVGLGNLGSECNLKKKCKPSFNMFSWEELVIIRIENEKTKQRRMKLTEASWVQKKNPYILTLVKYLMENKKTEGKKQTGKEPKLKWLLIRNTNCLYMYRWRLIILHIGMKRKTLEDYSLQMCSCLFIFKSSKSSKIQK